MPYTDTGIGYRHRDASREAAHKVEANAPSLRGQVYRMFLRHGTPMSADDVARILRRHVLSIRPRVTELLNKGLLRDSGQRGRSDLGKTQTLWEVAE